MINFSDWIRGVRRALAPIAAAFVLACGGAPHAGGDRGAERGEPEGRLWVLAPHPDDEVLMAGELLHAAALRGRPVSVVVMTNGDLSCARDGHARQGETIDALAVLGVHESDVHFLGYPDGYLDSLGPTPLAPLARTQPDGSCGLGDHTYASRGAGGLDVHTLRTGAPGAYVTSGPEEDLAWLLERERPTEIVTVHGIDTHPDHAMTYVYLRRALERVAFAPPRILRSVVHQGPCWPNGSGDPPCPDVRATVGTPFPPFAPPLAAYAPTLRIASTDDGASKRAAIAHYVSQLGAPSADESWLSSFARSDEVFYPEVLVRDPAVPTHLLREGAEQVRAIALDLDAGAATIPVPEAVAPPAVSLTSRDGGVALREGDRTLRLLPTPHGEDPALTHHYEVLVEHRASAGSIAEITVRRDGVPWMFAVVATELVVSDGAGRPETSAATR